MTIYIPMYLMPVPPIDTGLQRVAWIVLQDRANNLHILEGQALLLAMILVSVLTVYMGNLDLHINHLPETPKSTELMEMILEIFTPILTNALVPPAPPVPNVAQSLLTIITFRLITKFPPPLYQEERTWDALRQPTLPVSDPPEIVLYHHAPHTSPHSTATAVPRAAATPGTNSKTPSITFRCRW